MTEKFHSTLHPTFLVLAARIRTLINVERDVQAPKSSLNISPNTESKGKARCNSDLEQISPNIKKVKVG